MEFEPVCRQIANDLIDNAFGRGGSVEVTDKLAASFAARVQCAFLGWPEGLSTRLIEWVANNQHAIRQSNRAAISHLARQFEAIVDEQVDQRIVNRSADRGDVISCLMRERVFGRKLNSEELSSILRNWTVGEIGTIGAGIHVCPGAPLASMELQVFLESVLKKTTWLKSKSDSPAVAAIYPASGFSSLVIQDVSPPQH